jgi:hypothetical protein
MEENTRTNSGIKRKHKRVLLGGIHSDSVELKVKTNTL